VGKTELLSTQNVLFRKFAPVYQKIATFAPPIKLL